MATSFAVLAVGVIEITRAMTCGPSMSDDARFAKAFGEIKNDSASTAWAHASLANAHLHSLDISASQLDVDRAEEDFAADRAQLRGAKSDMRDVEKQLGTEHCTSAQPLRIVASPSDSLVEIRMELPVQYLQPLEQAVAKNSDRVLLYSGDALAHQTVIGTGSLTSVEGADDQSVVVRARIDDPRPDLREGEIVAVKVRLDHLSLESAHRLAGLQ